MYEFGLPPEGAAAAERAAGEFAAALEALVTRLPGLRPAGEPGRREEFVIRGLRTLPVTA
jgi:cytochrome P450